jgi:protocatechuate 3,4-dioxygenase beta subunit
MFDYSARSSRRLFLGAFAMSATALAARGAFAEQLLRTPQLTEGPFYPDHLPLDLDNDLIMINNNLTAAVGEITHLSGRVLTASGSPVKNATVEIWQCDAHEVYLHSSDSVPKKAQQDRNFQGFGRFETASSGEYRFRTIKPVPYPGRPAPHIHFKVKQGSRELLTSQLMIRGHQGNGRDGVFMNSGDALDRELIMADFKALPGSKVGELMAHFDIILGRTPDESSLTPSRLNRR